MRLYSARAKELETWMQAHPDHRTDTYESVEISGEIRRLEVWRFPLELLVYNIRNGRFTSELLTKERELRRSLDPQDPEDAQIIQELLLNQNPNETEALEHHINKYGQLEPGVITFDGAVINANRRLAIISKLQAQTGESKFGYLRAARLPASVTEKDLWRIEAGIQFAKDFKLDYGPVNELLKLREGRSQGLTPKEISVALLGRYSEKQIKERLEILKQIDSYLAFIKKPNEYAEVEGDVEKFNSLVRNVLQPLKRNGASLRELSDMNVVAFSLISSGDDSVTHWQIRKLRDVAQSDDARRELFRSYKPSAPDKTPSKTLVEAFTTALEIVEDKKAQEKPEQLIKRALTAIRAINAKSPKVRSAPVRELLKDLREEVDNLMSQARL